MLKFNMKFEDGEKTVEFETGRSSLWKAQDYGATLPETDSKKARTDFAWGFFAAAQADKLGELGVPEGAGVTEAVEFIGDNYDLTISDAKDKEAPLAETPAK